MSIFRGVYNIVTLPQKGSDRWENGPPPNPMIKWLNYPKWIVHLPLFIWRKVPQVPATKWTQGISRYCWWTISWDTHQKNTIGIKKNRHQETKIIGIKKDISMDPLRRGRRGRKEGQKEEGKEGRKKGKKGRKEGKEGKEGRKQGRKARKEGRKQGRREARKKGRKEGGKEGRREGRKQGRRMLYRWTVVSGTASSWMQARKEGGR